MISDAMLPQAAAPQASESHAESPTAAAIVIIPELDQPPASSASALSSTAVPRLGVGMRFRHDVVRDAWVILGPERLFLPDEHAVAVLKLVDGTRTVAAIAATLAATYNAPADVIEADIRPMLSTLAASGAVRW